MRIAIDASRVINEKAGIGRYTKKLIGNLLEIDKENDYILLFNFWNNFLTKKAQAESYKQKNTEIKCRRYPGLIKESLLKSNFGFNRFLNKEADIFLAPTFLDFDFSLKISQIVVIHDLSMFYYPEHLGKKLSNKFEKVTKMAAEKSDKIITISQSTKRDLIKTLNIEKDKISVIYPGLNKFPVVASKLPNGLKSQEYILAVGTIEPRKNLIGLIKAYAMLSEKLQNKYPLVLSGAIGWGTDEIFKEAEKIKDKIRFLSYQPDEMLAKLYKEAKVFVYPSFYEGFGFPIIEAMQFGTPVITSDLSSMPEAGGRAALYIDPEDSKSISGALQKVLEGKINIDKVSKLGQDQASKFSWEKTAKETLELIKDSCYNLKK